jgi:putative peptidoglycan lipid II flippase
VVVANIALSVLLVHRLGIGGIALALTLAAFGEMLLLLAFLQRRLAGLLDASFLGDLATLLLAAIVAGLAAFAVNLPISHLPLGPLPRNLAGLLFGGLAGAATYAGVAAHFGWREHERVLRLLRGRG